MNAHSRVLHALIALVTLVGTALAQERRADSETSRLQSAEEVRLAATAAKVEITDRLMTAFADSASAQSEVFAAVYANVAKDVRVARLVRYFSAKMDAKSKFAYTKMTADDLGDFHWGYIARDVTYSPARLESLKAEKLKLQKIESSGITYDFGLKGPPLSPGAAVLLPVARTQPAGVVTLTFDAGTTKALWTGHAAAGLINIADASTSRGCEIHVASEPPGATVYFNGKPWHRPTNTKSVRDPGSWEVVLRLQGYRDWKDQRSLGPGATWTINASLIKLEAK